MTFFPDTHPLVIAHRGLATAAPENTIPAFQAAVDVGADILETDVHLSKDGDVIVAHDPVLDRVAGRPGLVSDFTTAELAGIDLGGVGFPTLVEVLTAFPEARFNIDLKVPDVVPAFVDVIRQLDATPRVLVASFDENTRSAAVSQLDGVATSATKKHLFPSLTAAALGNTTRLASVLGNVDAVQIPPSYWGIPLVTKRFVRQLTTLGKHVHVWTINDPKKMQEFYRLGVTGIVTDRADLAIEVRSHVAS